MKILASVLAFLLLPATASAQATKEQWIELGTRIHGGFGVLIPIGIRIGLDARERLKGGARDLTVTYYTGDGAPCACIADGIMIATGTSPGQGSLKVADEKAPAGAYAVAVVRNRNTGRELRYTVPQEHAPKIVTWNRSLDPAARYDVAMNTPDLFQVSGE